MGVGMGGTGADGRGGFEQLHQVEAHLRVPGSATEDPGGLGGGRGAAREVWGTQGGTRELKRGNYKGGSPGISKPLKYGARSLTARGLMFWRCSASLSVILEPCKQGRGKV